MFSCNLCCRLIFLHGRSRTYRVASLRAGPVGRISYNLYFDCKHVRYVTCDLNHLINEYIKKKTGRGTEAGFRIARSSMQTFPVRFVQIIRLELEG